MKWQYINGAIIAGAKTIAVVDNPALGEVIVAEHNRSLASSDSCAGLARRLDELACSARSLSYDIEHVLSSVRTPVGCG